MPLLPVSLAKFFFSCSLPIRGQISLHVELITWLTTEIDPLQTFWFKKFCNILFWLKKWNKTEK